MSEHYDFHYQPTGSGAISGQQVLEQTEDAINELGDYVNDNVGGAMDVAQEALETAQNAQNDAQTALDTANSFSSAIQSAQQDASTALSTAQTAQTTASNANNTAIQASQDASSAVTTANNASGQVSTLSGTVAALGQRVTTAEGNIGQNASDITALTTRVGTAEGNITTLQNDVSIAQGNASSAMATAGTVKQQSYVLRYSSTTLVASSTNSNSLLDNTDNLKVGDKVIDSSGVIYSVTAIDTANSTFTIGIALIDLAQDSDVVHKSGDETIAGEKTFSDLQIIGYGTQYKGARNAYILPEFGAGYSGLSITTLGYSQTLKIGNFVLDANNKPSLDTSKGYIQVATGENNSVNACVLEPRNTTSSSLGSSSNKWSGIYATNYYYGNDNVEFSTKFVTTDTAQTISGQKTFTNSLNLKSNSAEYGVTSGNIQFLLMDKNSNVLSKINQGVFNSGASYIALQIYGRDENSQSITNAITFQYGGNFNISYLLPSDNGKTSLGTSSKKWSDVLTYKINSVEPSALGMPDLDNGVDISSYITVVANANKESLYTPPANGWISVRLSRTSGALGVLLIQGNMASSGKNIEVESGVSTADAMLPVVGGVQVSINSALADGIVSAYFYPCLGNV